MNKTALKNFAISARNELIERVELQAYKLGITKDRIAEADLESSDAIVINGEPLSDLQRNQRNQLINRIETKGYDQVIEEVAYTWFNRFVALRFMEVNDYLPTRVRVLSSEDSSSTEPDMIKEALTLDLDIDKEKIYEWKMNNDTDELFKYLIQLHCNDLNKYMPFMFETLEDYMMILFPEGLLGTESFVREMIDTDHIPEDNWHEIEIVGWLYQFYIAEEKDRVFKEKKKYKSSDIPFATQLFTPKWIVKYMVQNSLGKYWVESHPEDEDLINDWEFFIKNTDEEYERMKHTLVNSELIVEEIKCLDPAMGSGHILVYMFDVLYEIYAKRGYMAREIPKLIIENNLYGLDIDERAYQLAGFSIIMKALEYNQRFLRTIERDGLTLNLAAIEESNTITEKHIEYLELHDPESAKQYIQQFKNAKSIGSLLKLTDFDTAEIKSKIKQLSKTPVKSIFDKRIHDQILSYFPRILKQAKIMTNSFDILVTNPPYMGRRSMNKELTPYLDKHYPDSKADLFAAFMELDQYTKEKGFFSLINQHSWMFLSSFEKLRTKIINNNQMDTMLHLGARAFEEIGGEVVQSTAFVLRNEKNKHTKGSYIRLVDYSNAKEKEIKTKEAVDNPDISYHYIFAQDDFNKIPESPIAYWISNKLIKAYNNKLLRNIAFSDGQILTGNNNKFLRYIWEVNSTKISPNSDWALHAKGGEYRRWFGNVETVVKWDERSIEHYKSDRIARYPKESILFRRGVTWSLVSGGSKLGVRLLEEDTTFNKAAATILFFDENLIYYVLGYLNSKVAQIFLNIINPTFNNNIKDILNVPFVKNNNVFEEVNSTVIQNIQIAKIDWNSFETSWYFKKHPLLSHSSKTIESSYTNWQVFIQNQFKLLKSNEERLNRIFIETYGLEGELTPEVADKDITISNPDLERDIKSLISYAVGCALGRYSLDEEGLIYAGGEFKPSRYRTFPADENNVLPIFPDAYFEDDIVSLFIQFVETTYGSETLEENLTFVAEAIGKRKNESSRDTIRRYFLNNFYKDHVQTYKKHPIYWQFTSGKEKAFNCLIYMHRYDKTTLSRIRTDYLHDVQARYETIKNDLQYVIDSDASAGEVRAAKKELTSVERKVDELKEFDEKLHHMADTQIEIDLDDGVKENYKKFEGLVSNI